MFKQNGQQRSLQKQNGIEDAETRKTSMSPALVAWIERMEDARRRCHLPEMQQRAPLDHLIITLAIPYPGGPYLSELVPWLEIHGLVDQDVDETGLTPLMVFAGPLIRYFGPLWAFASVKLIADFSNWAARDDQGRGVMDYALVSEDPSIIAYVLAYQEQRALRQSIPMTDNQCSLSRKTRTL